MKRAPKRPDEYNAVLALPGIVLAALGWSLVRLGRRWARAVDNNLQDLGD